LLAATLMEAVAFLFFFFLSTRFVSHSSS